MLKLVVSTSLALFLSVSSVSAFASKTIAFFSPSEPGNDFWATAESFMQAACEDLGCTVKAYYADNSQTRMVQQAKDVLANEKPDAMVFQSFKNNGVQLIELADKHDVLAFMFNAGLSADQVSSHGAPREKYAKWIGQMLPDDQGAGADLISILRQEAEKAGLLANNNQVLGLQGRVADGASVERVKGLKSGLANYSDLDMKQLIPADWSKDVANNKFSRFSKRNKSVPAIVWAANDPMALGVVEAVKGMGKVPGKDVVTGGVDWTPDALKAVQSGELTTTIGGHFMEAGWVAVLLHDYWQGIDFGSDNASLKSRMSALTKDNVDSYLKHFGDQNWGKIDFKQLSKYHNKSLSEYQFTVDALLKQEAFL